MTQGKLQIFPSTLLVVPLASMPTALFKSSFHRLLHAATQGITVLSYVSILALVHSDIVPLYLRVSLTPCPFTGVYLLVGPLGIWYAADYLNGCALSHTDSTNDRSGLQAAAEKEAPSVPIEDKCKTGRTNDDI